jgi:hypothetical protein
MLKINIFSLPFREFSKKYLLFLYTIVVFILYVFLFTEVSAFSGSVMLTSTGGNCTLVGTWDGNNKTCTLNDDILGPINISGNNIILDGNNHILQPMTNERIGINASGDLGIVIKNLNIQNFTIPIIFQRVSNSIIQNVNISNSGSYGLFMLGGQNNKFLDSTINGGYMGIWTDSGGHKISNNSFVNISTYGISLYYQNAKNILIENNIFDGNNHSIYGIYSEYNKDNIIKGNTFKNNIGPGYFEFDNAGNGTVIVQNNFINNGLRWNEGQTSNRVYATLSQDFPIGGNYWNDFDNILEGCSDQDNNGICDSPKYINTFDLSMADFLPWTTENGWIKKLEPMNFYAEIKNMSGVTTMRENPGISESEIKTLPNGWVVYIESKTDVNGLPVLIDGYTWYKVSDPTDNSTGWMPAKSNEGVTFLEYDKDKQDIFKNKSTIILETKSARVDSVVEAVDHYLSNSDTSKSLYSSDDHSLKISNLAAKGFPKDLILAIIAQEIGGEDFDNENVSFDYGHGLMQITMNAYNDFIKNKSDPRGILSDIHLGKCKNLIKNPDGSVTGLNEYKKCYSPVYNSNGQLYANVYDNYDHISTNPKYKQYANTVQSIFANIKDGLGILTQKYNVALNNSCKQGDYIVEGYTFNCNDMRKIKTVWYYNGKSFKSSENYMENISNKLKNISKYFPGINYSNEDNLIEKLSIANRHRVEIQAHSPIELRVVDSGGKILGLVDGKVIDEIPNGIYDIESERAVVFFPSDQYTYKVVGDSTGGTYGLDINTVNEEKVTSFTAVDIPIIPGEIHTFSINNTKLSEDTSDAVTITIDKNGDGIPEDIIKSDKELTSLKQYDFSFIRSIENKKEYNINNILPIHIRVFSGNARNKIPIQHPVLKITRVSDGYIENMDCNLDNKCFANHNDHYTFSLPKNTLTEGEWNIEVGIDNGVTHSIIINMVK